MKKLINDPADVVKEALQGMQAAHGDLLSVTFDPYCITRKNVNTNKAAVISGGGSGHEPLHGGYVGKGMLDAALPGEVFTSPTPDQACTAAKLTKSSVGTLFLVKNYTGDIMNFQMAEDMLKDEGAKAETVVINDDVAVKDSLYTTGRRGVGGTVLVEKIAGALAEKGASLADVAKVAKKVNDNVRSMGMALSPCTVPAAGKPNFTLADDEIEMGIGIHGEPGRERTKLPPANAIVDTMLEAVLGDIPFKSGDETIVMVNGMGGTPLIELYLLYARVADVMGKKGMKIARRLVGNYITSLEMQGFSITVLRADAELISLWDEPVLTPALRWGA